MNFDYGYGFANMVLFQINYIFLYFQPCVCTRGRGTSRTSSGRWGVTTSAPVLTTPLGRTCVKTGETTTPVN